jgi:hypothetical protein
LVKDRPRRQLIGPGNFYNVHGSSSTGHDEENVALAPNNKKKIKKRPKGGNKPKGEGKKDMSKVKCFACHKFGHYAS